METISPFTFFKKQLQNTSLHRGIRLAFISFVLFLVIITSIKIQELSTVAQATGSVVAFEVEDGTITSPAASLTDVQASAGHAVNLGTATSIACSGVSLSTSDDIQAELDANPTGTTFCFQPGTYRLTSPLNPKNNQSLIGAYGAVLNGAKVVTGFTQSGSDWVATGFLPSSPETHGQCSTAGCTYTQDVFLDGQPLTRVTSQGALASGKFYEDFANNQIYLRDNPTGHVVEQSYASAIVASSSTGVTVKNFIIEKAATVAQEAALRTQTASTSAANWTIANNEIRYNHAGGVYANKGSIVKNNYIHHQGQTGIYGDFGAILVENNEVAYNNTAGYDSIWEAGGSKWARTDGTIIRGNYFHDNNGPGIWTDILNNNVLIEDNVSVRNKQVGIFHEISYAATIRNNIAMDNTNLCEFHYFCGAQILISASPDVEVYGNTVRGWGGIGILQQDRSADFPDPVLGPHIVENVYIHDNESHAATVAAVAGAATDTGDDSIFTSRNNRYEDNNYHLNNISAQYFYWLGDDHPKSEWQGEGMDTDGTFDTNVNTDPAPVLQLNVGPVTSTTSGAVTATVNVPTTGTYRVWSRLLTPDATNDSYMLQVDNGPLLYIGDGSISANTWTWVDYRNGDTTDKVSLDLTAGNHTVKLFSRDSGVKIDRVIFITDTTCTPTGDGDNCAPVPTNTPTPTPTSTPTPTNTPTPTPTPVLINSGYTTTINGNFDSGNNNGISATQVTSGASGGTLNSITIYIGAVGASPNNTMQVAIYANTGSNKPGTRLGTTGSQALTANSWNTFSLTGVSISANTKYWLAFNENSSTTQYGRASTNSGKSAWKIPTTYGTWPNPMGTLSEPVGTRAYSIYMTYTAN